MQPRSKQQEDEIHRQSKRTQSAVVQNVNAAERLTELEKQLERADTRDRITEATSHPLTVRAANTRVISVSGQIGIISELQDSIKNVTDPAQRQGYIVERAPEVVQHLLAELTNLGDSDAADAGAADNVRSGDQHGQNTISLEELFYAPTPPPPEQYHEPSPAYVSVENNIDESPEINNRRRYPSLSRRPPMPPQYSAREQPRSSDYARIPWDMPRGISQFDLYSDSSAHQEPRTRPRREDKANTAQPRSNLRRNKTHDSGYGSTARKDEAAPKNSETDPGRESCQLGDDVREARIDRVPDDLRDPVDRQRYPDDLIPFIMRVWDREDRREQAARAQLEHSSESTVHRRDPDQRQGCISLDISIDFWPAIRRILTGT